MPIYVRSKRLAPAPAPPKAVPGKKGPLLFGLPEPPPGWPQKPPGLSVCMIVKNEERFLAQCLRSAVDVADEIVVVDTGSSDRTIEIAKSFGAVVVEREWRDDFAWARNQALELASYRWILCLDADEELMPQSRAPLQALKSVPAHRTAVWVRIYNRSDDYVGTGDMSHALVRIFPNDAEIRYRGLIHEFPTVGGDVNGLPGATSPIAIVHHGYTKDVVHDRHKGARNLAIVKAAAERDPSEAYNWFNVGATAFLVGDYETARDSLERMIELVGDQHRGFVPNGLTVLAETYCDKLGDALKGEAIARRCLAISPHYANAHFQLGKALIAQKRFDEGREAYLAAIDDGKYAGLQFVIDDQVYIWKAHSEIGSSYVMQGDDIKAIEWFEKGLKNAPKAEPLHVNRARAFERLGRLEEADEVYRSVYELHKSPSSTIEYVNALLRRNRLETATRVIEENYARFPAESAVPLLMAAAAVAQKNGSPDDERYLRLAANVAPGSAEVLNPLEVLLRARGKEAEVADLVAREERSAPISSADYLRRAQRAANAGEFARARDLAEQGLERFPASEALGYAVAFSLARLGERDRALPLLKELAERESDVTIAASTLRATLLREAGRAAEAISAIDRAIALDGARSDLWMTRAALMEEIGSPAGQEESLIRAFALDARSAALALSGFYLRHGRVAEAAAVADRALAQ